MGAPNRTDARNHLTISLSSLPARLVFKTSEYLSPRLSTKDSRAFLSITNSHREDKIHRGIGLIKKF